MYQQSSYDLQFLRYRVWQTEIVNYGSFFALLPSPLKTKNIRILKKWKKNCCRYHHFTQVYQKPQSYEVQFLRHRVRQTEFFVILGHFLQFYPLATRKIKILKKWKNYLEISSFYTWVPKITITWSMLSEIFWAIFCPLLERHAIECAHAYTCAIKTWLHPFTA